ncbi:hypothetical protein [Psychrobacter sp. I-STPA6b]|uniref:hypothetical protein n=1 Tax=Psychrobacter sp. I-STPA6b TaxID=2585718 RepID=UPI001D0C09B7|nr:hypothetical protein [Psychrobacter sp. I-STPA6b]
MSFVSGTLINTEQGLVPIQDLKVGDLVLSKPEDGIGEPVYKSVVKTFMHEDKEIWLVRAKQPIKPVLKAYEKLGHKVNYEKHNEIYVDSEMLVTSNHPIWVVGYVDSRYQKIFYPNPFWKRVDELIYGELITNADGNLLQVVNAQPIYKFNNPSIENNNDFFWVQERYHQSFEDYWYGEIDPDYWQTEAEFKADGKAYDINNYINKGSIIGGYVLDDRQNIIFTNSLIDKHGDYIPFTMNVYNIEVADNHTYFVSRNKVWVHNTDCEETAREILLGKKVAQGFSSYKPNKGKNSAIGPMVSQCLEQDSVGCFVGGTIISVDNEDRIKNIDNITVGDSVLSRPETGENIVSYQPVVQTFIHKDKAIWLLKAEKTTEMFDKNDDMLDYQRYSSAGRNIEVLVTPNHPVWVIGCYEHPDADIEFYEQPQWKRVDELQRYEVVINPDGVMYRIERAQPVYQYLAKGESEPNPDLYWYQEHYYEDYDDDYVQGDYDFEGLLSEQEFNKIGYVYDVTQYETKSVSKFIGSKCINYLTNEKGQYIPFTRPVYNLEVANNHTYYVGVKGLWVHE